MNKGLRCVTLAAHLMYKRALSTLKNCFYALGIKNDPALQILLKKQAQISSHVTLRHEQNRKRMNGSHTGP